MTVVEVEVAAAVVAVTFSPYFYTYPSVWDRAARTSVPGNGCQGYMRARIKSPDR